MSGSVAGRVRRAVPVRMELLLLCGLLCLGVAAAMEARAAAPRLAVDSGVATAGYYRLSWETDSVHAELQQAGGAGFGDAATLYRGPDRATVISGRPDGIWYYRVRAIEAGQPGPWSEPLSVTVRHHSLGRAIAFFALGLLVFLGILLLVTRGAWQETRETKRGTP